MLSRSLSGTNKTKNHYLAICTAESADIGAIIIVIAGIILGVLKRKLDLSKHEIIGLVLGSMSPEDHLLDGVVLPGRFFAIGKPFDGERR